MGREETWDDLVSLPTAMDTKGIFGMSQSLRILQASVVYTTLGTKCKFLLEENGKISG